MVLAGLDVTTTVIVELTATAMAMAMATVIAMATVMGQTVATRESAVVPGAPVDVPALPPAEPATPGDRIELPATEPVDPAVPAGERVMSSDGLKMTSGEPVSESAVTLPAETAAAHCAPPIGNMQQGPG